MLVKVEPAEMCLLQMWGEELRLNRSKNRNEEKRLQLDWPKADDTHFRLRPIRGIPNPARSCTDSPYFLPLDTHITQVPDSKMSISAI